MPPPWADPSSNPCAAQPRGWQLLYWPADGKCYKIFQAGANFPSLARSIRESPSARRKIIYTISEKCDCHFYDRSVLRVRKPWSSAPRPAAAERQRSAGVRRGPRSRLGTPCAIRYSRERPVPRVNSSPRSPRRPARQGKRRTVPTIRIHRRVIPVAFTLMMNEHSFQRETSLGNVPRARGLRPAERDLLAQRGQVLSEAQPGPLPARRAPRPGRGRSGDLLVLDERRTGQVPLARKRRRLPRALHQGPVLGTRGAVSAGWHVRLSSSATSLLRADRHVLSTR